MVLSALAPSNSTQPYEIKDAISNSAPPLSIEAIGTALDFAINTTNPEFPSLASNVSQTIHECFVEYNNANAQEDGYVYFLPWYYEIYSTVINQTAMNDSPFPIYDVICPLEISLNQDIGGIGVSQRCAD